MGQPISGVVTGHTIYSSSDGWSACQIEVETNTGYQAILPYHFVLPGDDLIDSHRKPIRRDLNSGNRNSYYCRRTELGRRNLLYLSTRPTDLDEQQIASYRSFYQAIDQLEPRTLIEGTVEKIMPFGIFVNLSLPFPGLMDLGYSGLAGAKGYLMMLLIGRSKASLFGA